MDKFRQSAVIITAAMALTTSLPTAGAVPVGTPEDLATVTRLLGPLTRHSSSRHVCGESPYRHSIGMTGGLMAGLGSGAATGAMVGTMCDVAMLGMTFGLCTLAAASVGATMGGIISMEAADLISGWRDCSGAIYLTPRREIAMQLDADSHTEMLDIASRRNAKVLALFDDYVYRCGAAAWHTPRQSADAGKPFVGIGSTATAAEMEAVRSCRQIMGSGERCEVLLQGACNSWR